MRTSIIKIIKFLQILLLTSFSLCVCAQSKLPPCPAVGVKSECVGEIVYSDGLRYVGEWLDDKRHGYGELTIPKSEKYKVGGTYKGEFQNGSFYGSGVIEYLDGVILSGEITSGKGSGVYPNGKYEGNFKSFARNGFGVFKFSNGSKYEGNWLSGKQEGQGVMINADGSKYDGNWLSGKAEGQGVMVYANGFKYEGSWQNDMRDGRGELIYSDGSKYSGEFGNNFINGRGLLTAANGNKYEGLWKNNIISEGTLTYSNSSIYKGLLDKFMPNGQGVIIFADGSKYSGQWVDGKYSGEGLLTYANGAIYKGGFLDGKHSGRGVLAFQNGSKMDGEFANGKFLSGRVIHVDGTSYVGGFQDGKKNGKGTLYNKDGSVKYSGIWSNDVPNQPIESKAVVAKNSARPLLDTVEEEKTCESIGFKRKTEAFANCVLELMDRNNSNIASGDPDDSACRGYGFKPKTSDYASCRQQIDMARQNAQRQQSQFEDQNRLYEEQLALQKKEIKRANNQRALDMSLRLLNGQSPTDAVLGVGTGAPIRPANPSNSQLIQMPGGRMVNCITNGGLTQCY